ncbi:hypothetical protein NSTC731_04384 [Nostoc sp. DSM 114167]|jgi:hypothetical protein
MGEKGLKFLLIFLAILLILSMSLLSYNAKNRCKSVKKFKEKFRMFKLIAIHQFLTS